MSRMRATGFLAAALLFAAAAFDSPSLYVPAIGLALLAAAAAAWARLARRGASVQRLPGAWSVIEGETYRLAIEVRRARVLGGMARVIDPLLEEPLPVGSDQDLVLHAETRFQRRGRHELPVVSLELFDPFGLRSARMRGSEATTVLVLPRVEAVSAPPLSGELTHGGGTGGGPGAESGLEAAGVDFELDGLRPYRRHRPGRMVPRRVGGARARA